MAEIDERLALWSRAPFTGGGLTYDVYSRGSGPGVVVMPEVPGISPQVLDYVEHLVAEGFSVAMPSLFGTPGQTVSGPYVAGVLAKLCVSKEMRAFATNAERPISLFLRALAADLNARTPGPGVGVVGMCFTGGFALAVAVDDSVLAAVMSQPSVPLPIGAARKRDLGLSPAEATTLKERIGDGLCIMGLRFSEDKSLSAERFSALSSAFGDAFEMIVLDSSKGNEGGYGPRAHSVISLEVKSDPPNSAYDARARTVDFLRRQISPTD